MKPYTTIKVLPEGVRYLSMQLAGTEPMELTGLLHGRQLLACWIPVSQTAGAAWLVIWKFDHDVQIELTCSSTSIESWKEFGTVNVEVVESHVAGPCREYAMLELPDELYVARTEIVRWLGAGLIVDAGIRLHFSDGRLLSVVAVDIPGAMCLTLPGHTEPQSWQFPANQYACVAVDETA
ncbi:hypothetical protein [Stenotrophomonas sp.]|uniref:hypothetical protein n=1 Tax=Stenotrophomonas sp. TaxID=69392 RepID=UPI0028978503|nr:hypothetical protein [Stenotrophomonas sp.]